MYLCKHQFLKNILESQANNNITSDALCRDFMLISKNIHLKFRNVDDELIKDLESEGVYKCMLRLKKFKNDGNAFSFFSTVIFNNTYTLLKNYNKKKFLNLDIDVEELKNIL